MEWRQCKWRGSSMFLVTCGSVLAGTLLFWYLHVRHRRRWNLVPPISPALTHTSHRCQSHRTSRSILRQYSVSHYRIQVVESWGSCEEILLSKTPHSLRIIGLDCEWVAKERGASFLVALLQLAFLDGHCLLVRLCKTKAIPSTLLGILQDSKILKFGIAINNDAKRLQTGFGVYLSGWVDLQHIAVRCGLRRRGLGLRGLAASLLGVELDKSWRLRCGNWESEELSDQQIRYAASDAAVALDILKALLHVKMDGMEHRQRVHQVSNTCSGSGDLLSPIPLSAPSITKNDLEQNFSSGNESRADSLERKHDIPEEHLVMDKGTNLDQRDSTHVKESSGSLLKSEAHSVLLSLCQGVVDVVYKQPRSAPNTTTGLQKSQCVQPKRLMHAHCARQSPLYHNCRLLAPDGSLLSVVDRKKIQWYLERQLGTLISETPPTVQLTFEPSGKPGKDQEYYLVQKENICVVCGCDKSCIRKNIVPHEYRKLFPAELKDHISHDILLMCVSCHQLATMHSNQLKRQLAEEYRAPLSTACNTRFQQDPKLVRVKNLARALLRGHSIPESRRDELEAGVAEYWECAPDNLTPEMIQDAAQIDTRHRNASYCPHAEMVVRRICETADTAGLLEFQKRWRQHFLDSMEPRFLPDLWSVDHNPHQ